MADRHQRQGAVAAVAPSVAVTRILQPRWQPTPSASARRASTPVRARQAHVQRPAPRRAAAARLRRRRSRSAARRRGHRSAGRGCCGCRRRRRRRCSPPRSRSAGRIRRARCRASPHFGQEGRPSSVEHLDAVVFAVDHDTPGRRRRRRSRSGCAKVPVGRPPRAPLACTAPAGDRARRCGRCRCRPRRPHPRRSDRDRARGGRIRPCPLPAAPSPSPAPNFASRDAVGRETSTRLWAVSAT